MLKVIATHEYVSNFIKYTGDKRGMVLGKCLDETVSKMNYYNYKYQINRDISLKALKSYTVFLKSEFEKHDIVIDKSEMRTYYAMGWKFINAFKKSVLYENMLLRDRTRIVTINDDVGIYAQPDFVDYADNVIYEMKSFSLKPLPEYVRKQVRIFQLAYPNFNTVIIGFPRNEEYIKPQIVKLTDPKERTKKILLKKLYRYAMEYGKNIDYEEAIGNRKCINYRID